MMNNLIKRLDKYEFENFGRKDQRFFDTEDKICTRGIGNKLSKVWLISDEYGFVRWLWNKNKLRLDPGLGVRFSFYKTWRGRRYDLHQYYDIESILMQLAIEEEPIELLARITKDYF